MEDYYQKIAACPYGCHLLFVARQDQHLEECTCRKAYMAERTSQEITAQKRCCRFDKTHIVNDVELELHEMKCYEEHKRRMEKKIKQGHGFTAVIRRFFRHGTEKAREAVEELAPDPKPEPAPSGRDDANHYNDSPQMIFELEL